MGFDKQCILDIRSVAKHYFCPVCHTLVYPDEALQLQCTHLYCKPCLIYLLNTRRACPHDRYYRRYRVTAADSKPLVESNRMLAETIGKVAVRCLYYMSGCKWKGQLSECKTHCPECSFGDSPVTCNRCGKKMVHREVENHAQLNCPGVRPQPQPQAQLQTGPQTMPHHPSQAVMGHRSYRQPNQQLPPGPPHLQFVHIHPQQQGAPIRMPQPALQMQPHFSQQQMGPMHPLHYHVPMQQQQYAMLPQGQCPYVTPAPLHVHQHAHQQQQSLSQQSSDRQSLHPQSFPGQAPGLVQNTQQPTHFILQQTIHAQVCPVRQMQDKVYAQSSHVVSVCDNQPNYGPSQMQAQLHLRPPQPDQLPPLNSHPSDGGFFNAGKAVSLDQSRKRKHWSIGAWDGATYAK